RLRPPPPPPPPPPLLMFPPSIPDPEFPLDPQDPCPLPKVPPAPPWLFPTLLLLLLFPLWFPLYELPRQRSTMNATFCPYLDPRRLTICRLINAAHVSRCCGPAFVRIYWII